MADETQKKPAPKAVGGELVIPIAAVLFTIYYFITIRGVPFNAQASALFVGCLLLLFCTALFVRVVLSIRRGEASLAIGRLIEPVSFVPKRLILLTLTIAYIFFVTWLGFTLTTFLFLALSMTLLNRGQNKRFILGLSAILAICGWLLFVVAFKTRFPEGPFELLIERLV